MKVIEKIALVSTVNDDREVLETFAEYHLGIGILFIWFFYDGEPDLNIGALESDRIRVTFCDKTHWQKIIDDGRKPSIVPGRQVANVNFAAPILEKEGYKWLIHLDSDELVFPRNDLQATLQSRKEQIVGFSIREAIVEENTEVGLFTANKFKKLPKIKHRVLGALLSVTPILARSVYEGNFFLGPTLTKMAHRLPVRYKIGVHGVHATPMSSNPVPWITLEDVLLLHFNGTSYKIWRRKWQEKIDRKKGSLRHGRMKQLEAFRQALEADDPEQELRNLYSEMHVLSPLVVKWLERIDLAEEINLDIRG